MRLVTYSKDAGSPRLGALRAGQIVDLAAAAGADADADAPGADHFKDTLALIRSGRAGLMRARQLLEEAPSSAIVELSSARLLAPLLIPEQVRCFSAFEEHGRNSAQVMLKKMAALADDPTAEEARLRASGNFDVPRLWYERPLYYKANRFNWVGPDTDIVWPAYSHTVDYELELACIIGSGGRDISKQEAGNHIFGYAVCNDLSARDTQAIEMRAPLGPAKGKDFDGGNVLGPCIVTADEISPYTLMGTVRVNGERWGGSSSSGMHHRFEDMIAYVSQSETLHPGEIFLSGCFATGSAMEIGRSVRRGDVLELEIENLGVLRNRIV
jgi:2-keto-4-pentenoate hydratase/2-oxohepta-3-ene-1,7-dioic acid hydratase in catechol pathway